MENNGDFVVTWPPAPGRTQPFSALVMMTFVPRACESSSVAQTSSSSAARDLPRPDQLAAYLPPRVDVLFTPSMLR